MKQVTQGYVPSLEDIRESSKQDQNPFGEVIYAFSRAQAVEDGFQVEVTNTAREAGIGFPVFLNRTVFDACVSVPPGVTGQDEAGRLWDILWMLRFAIIRAKAGVSRIPVALYVRTGLSRGQSL